MIAPMTGPMEPLYPCRQWPTRHCPAVYGDVCGPQRLCARFESDDEAPWLYEALEELWRRSPDKTVPRPPD